MTPLAVLLDAVTKVLARLPDPARSEIAARLHHDPEIPTTPASPPVVARHLAAALDAATAEPALVAATRAAAPALAWVTYDAYPPDRIGAAFRTGHAFAPLIGADRAPFPARDFDAGLFLMAPGLDYPDRRHPAPELYLPLTGPHLWRFDGADAFAPLPAGAPVWNPPHRIHATRCGAEPFLALYVWTRDVDAPAELS